jgi:hypothetical protein
MTFSKVHKKGIGCAKEEKNDGEIKAYSKAWFGYMQVHEEKKEEKERKIAHMLKKQRESHTKNKIKVEFIQRSIKFPYTCTS